MDQEQPQKSSRRLWIIVGGIVALALIIIGLVYALSSNGTKKEPNKVSSSSSVKSVNAKAKAVADMKVLSDSLKQASKDQAAAQKVVDASKNQVKVMP